MPEDVTPRPGRLTDWSRRLDRTVEARYAACLAVTLTLGAVFRFGLIRTTTSPSEPFNLLYPGYTDGAEYVDNARSLVETGTFGYAGRASAFRPPAYPFLISLTWRLFGETLTPIRLVQVGLFAVMAWLYARSAAQHFGRTAGILTAGGLALYPLFAFLATEVATESLYMAIASALFALTPGLATGGSGVGRRTALALVAGLACGVGTLTRPNMYFAFLLLEGLIVWGGVRRREGWRAWVAPALGLAVGTYLVLVPWMMRNARQVGAPVLSTNLEYNFFRGTFDLVDGLPFDQPIEVFFSRHNVLYEELIEDTRTARLPITEIENERRAREATILIVRADPGGWLKQRLVNAVYLWLNLQWDADLLCRSPVVSLARAAVTLAYFVLLAGALAGTLSLWRFACDPQQRFFVATAWLYIAAAMPTVLTFVGKRYRVSTIDPYLAILASVSLASWLRRRAGPGVEKAS